jgi:anti-anti-sigma factor
MELKLSHEPGYVLARTVGPIDDSVGELFREYLHPLVGQGGTRLILDLSQSNFITSKGLGQMVSLAVHANTNSSRVILAGCTPFVSVVMDRSKLSLFFEIVENAPTAIRRALDGGAS